MDVDEASDEAPRGAAISVIAVPLAGAKLTKRLYKISKKASASKMLKRGVKEVVKALRKGEKGCVVVVMEGAEGALRSLPSPSQPLPPRGRHLAHRCDLALARAV